MYKETLIISKDSYTSVYEDSYVISLSNSLFTENLIKFIVSGGEFPRAKDVDLFSDVNEVAKKYKVKIKKNTANNFAFTYDGKTYSATLVDHSEDNVYDFEITVSSGNTTCKNISNTHYGENSINSTLCDAKNKEFFTYKESSKRYIVTEYSYNNNSEFDECIKELSTVDIEDISNSSEAEDESSSSENEEGLSLKKVYLTTIKKANYCVTNTETTEFDIEDVILKSSHDYYNYAFANDSLFLFKCANDDHCTDEGDIYVGGKAGEINGTWAYTGCYKDLENNYTSCYDNDDESILLNFTEDTVFITEVSNFDTIMDYNLGESEFTQYLIGFLADEVPAPSVEDIPRLGDPSYYTSDSITINSSSKNKVTVTINGIQVTTQITKAQKNPTIINLEVSTNDIVCKLNYGKYSAHSITDDMCNVKNQRIFNYRSGETDQDRFYYVNMFIDSNEDEFNDCLREIAIITLDDEKTIETEDELDE